MSTINNNETLIKFYNVFNEIISISSNISHRFFSDDYPDDMDKMDFIMNNKEEIGFYNRSFEELYEKLKIMLEEKKEEEVVDKEIIRDFNTYEELSNFCQKNNMMHAKYRVDKCFAWAPGINPKKKLNYINAQDQKYVLSLISNSSDLTKDAFYNHILTKYAAYIEHNNPTEEDMQRHDRNIKTEKICNDLRNRRTLRSLAEKRREMEELFQSSPMFNNNGLAIQEDNNKEIIEKEDLNDIKKQAEKFLKMSGGLDEEEEEDEEVDEESDKKICEESGSDTDSGEDDEPEEKEDNKNDLEKLLEEEAQNELDELMNELDLMDEPKEEIKEEINEKKVEKKDEKDTIKKECKKRIKRRELIQSTITIEKSKKNDNQKIVRFTTDKIERDKKEKEIKKNLDEELEKKAQEELDELMNEVEKIDIKEEDKQIEKKRKRGRPPKALQKPKKPIEFVDKKMGRPPKPKPIEEEPKVKKRVGRPSKQKPIEEEPKIKRRVGRPSKKKPIDEQ